MSRKAKPLSIRFSFAHAPTLASVAPQSLLAPRRTRITAIFLAAAVSLLGATAAFAHAQLQSASPPVGGSVEPPNAIQLNFSEAVEAKFCQLTLKNAAGATQTTAAPTT